MDDRITDYISRKTGLVLSSTQRAALQHYVAKRQTAFEGNDAIGWLDDPREFRRIIDSLTVRETFFYRYEGQFDAFRDRLLPRMLADARAQGRPVRVWSAGCCSGEEPFTLAIIAAEMGCASEVEILATDINENYLEAAMTGAFSRRSIEKLPQPILEKYFTPARDQFLICDDLRRRVTFKWLNLADATYPSFLNGTSALDMIWCRNVLIYFEKPNVQTVIDRFAECLVPSGVLALGHSEMLPHDWTLTVAAVGDAFFYTRRAAAPPQVMATAPAFRPAPPKPKPRRVVARAPLVSAPPLAPPLDSHALLDQAELLADRGRVADAERMCQEAIARDPSLERAHYLLGLLEMDRPAQAIAHFRKAIYLDTSHLAARLHLAQCAEKLGRIDEAIREYRNLERLAGSRPPDDVLDAREGITVGMLTLMGRRAIARFETSHGGPTS